MTLRASARLLIGGREVASTPGAVSSVPVVLSGATMTWGRADALSQPDPDEITATLILPEATAPHLAGLRPGTMVELVGSAEMPGSEHAIYGETSVTGATLKTSGDATTLTRTTPGAPATVTEWATAELASVTAWVLPGTYRRVLQPGDPVTVHTSATALTGTLTVDVVTADPTRPGTVATTTTVTTLRGPSARTTHVVNLPATAPSPCLVGVRYTLAGTDSDQTTTTTTPSTWAAPPASTWATATTTWATATTSTSTTRRVAAGTWTGSVTGWAAGRYEWTVGRARLSSASLPAPDPGQLPRMTIRAQGAATALDGVEIPLDGHPGPEQTAQRVSRIITEANRTGLVTINPTVLGAWTGPLSASELGPAEWRRVSVRDALEDLTTSLMVTTSARYTHTGAIDLIMSSPATRRATGEIQVPAGGPATVTDAVALILPAAVFPSDTVRYDWAPATTATAAEVTWQERYWDTEANKWSWRGHTARVTSPDAATLGVRTVRLETDVVTQEAAEAGARALLDSTASGTWRVTGLTWDTRLPWPTGVTLLPELQMFMRLMGATHYASTPIQVRGIAPWAPTSPALTAYVEGGHLTYLSDGGGDGHWEVGLTVTSPDALAQSAQWIHAPATHTWAASGALTWADTATATY